MSQRITRVDISQLAMRILHPVQNDTEFPLWDEVNHLHSSARKQLHKGLVPYANFSHIISSYFQELVSS